MMTALLEAEHVTPQDPHGLESQAWKVVRKDKYDRVVVVVAEGLAREEAFARAGL